MRRRESLNLARRGFSNLRPHRRAALILSMIGLGLLGVNAFLYGRYQAGSAEIRQELRQVETRIEEELRTVQELETALERLDLESQNEQVAFLNERIAERTFPWSTLFDRLEEVLPAEVRLTSLTPSPERRAQARRRRGRTGDGSGSVLLAIAGEAQGDEGLLAFLDGLFGHPAFAEPNLVSERREGGLVRFQLGARYIPSVAAPPVEGPQMAGESAGEPGTGEEATMARRRTDGASGPAAGEPPPTTTARDTGYAESGDRAPEAWVSPRGPETGEAATTRPTQAGRAAPGGGVGQGRQDVGGVAGERSPRTSGTPPTTRRPAPPATGVPASGRESRPPFPPRTASAPPRLRGAN